MLFTVPQFFAIGFDPQRPQPPVAVPYLLLVLFLSTLPALQPPKCAHLRWLQDRAPSQGVMAVIMVDNSHGCLNHSPFGKQPLTIRGTNVFHGGAHDARGWGCAINAWSVFKQGGLCICLLYIIPLVCSPESVPLWWLFGMMAVPKSASFSSHHQPTASPGRRCGRLQPPLHWCRGGVAASVVVCVPLRPPHSCHPENPLKIPKTACKRQHAVSMHWEAYGRGSLPLHNLISDSVSPLTTFQIRYHSHCGVIAALGRCEP